MLQIETLYNHLEYEYNEDLDYIDDIYNYLHISRLLHENENEAIINKKMELLDEGLFLKLKYDDIQIKSLAQLLKKYNKEKCKLECNINKFLKQYNINLSELVLIHVNISKAKLEHDEKKLNILNHKLEKWWSWISNKIIDFITNYKQGDNSENISKILVCKKIFKLLNLHNKISNIEMYTFKLIIYDIKNYGKRYLEDYDYLLLENFYKYLNDELNNKYDSIFNMEIDNSKEEIINYLLMNENMYNLDKNNNIIITNIEDNIELFFKLNNIYNLYKMLKLFLKEQYDNTQTIVLDNKIQEYLNSINIIINELSNKEIEDLLTLDMNLNKDTKNKYYFFVNYLNNILLAIFNIYISQLNNNVKNILENKHNCLKEFKKTYTKKI